MRKRAEMRRWNVGWSVGLALLGLVFGALTATARAYDTPPARAARLSYLQGSVTVVRMDNTGSDTAQLNMPLAEGLRVSTGENGQAEIEFEDGSLVRLTPNSSLGLDSMSVDASGNFQTQLALVQGLVYAELRAASKYVYRLSAGGVDVSPVENTVVRIDLDEPPAVIAVLSGTAHVERSASGDGEGYRTDVRAGETLSGDPADSGRYSLTQQIPEESWDVWNEERDQAASDEAASQTAARDNYAGDHGYGWSDLDANGSWYDVPGQGRVWQPAVAADADFDPYGYGSWVWYPSAGYVWASGYGWGWTPYRCGSWSYWNGFGWGWMPGGNWGFGRGGGFNIVRPPQNYRFKPLPVRSPGGVHPIVVVNPGRGPNRSLQPLRGPRTIAGQMVVPLRPIGNSYTPRGGSAVGASLRRDFPIDRNSRQPVMGNVVTPGAAPIARPGVGWRSGVPRPGNGRAGDGTPAAVSPGQPIRSSPPAGQRIDGTQGVHPTQGQQDRDRPASRIAPLGQSPSQSSRPAMPNPVARPITPPPSQAPRPMPSMQRSEPTRSMPSAQPQRSAPAPAQRSSPVQK